MWRRFLQSYRWRRLAIGLAVVAAIALLLCFVPLMNLLGYEFALVMSLVASLVAGTVAVAYPERVRYQLAPYPGAQGTVVRLYGVTLSMGLALLVLPLVFISLNAFRVKNCDLSEGLVFFLLGPLCSVAVAVAHALFIGLLLPGRLGTVLWIVAWLGSFGAVFYELWATPSVQVFGSMHGYFSGVLYDEAVRIPTRWVTFRIRDAVEVMALLGLASLMIDRSQLRLRLERLGERPIRLVGWLPWVALSLVGFFLAPRLGHRCGASDLARALGGHRTYRACELVYPAELTDEESARLVRECAFHLEQVQEFFDAELPHPLRVYLFSSPSQKQELIGAGRTSVAKPWRGEVYIQGATFPHPVLKHEIAHVVAGVFGASPLQVSGRFGGILVSPGLVEGAAVAAAWDSGDLTPHQWSRAMHDLDVAPPLPSVLGLRFFGVNAGRAYVLAGSFSRYLIEEYGPARYRQAYRTADVAGAYGHSLGELEEGWKNFLAEQPLRPGDVELARNRFVAPAIHQKQCAHEVAQLREHATNEEARGAWDRALERRLQVVNFTPEEGRARWELARGLLFAGRQSEATTALEALSADSDLPQWVRTAAARELADLQWAAGENEGALEAYRQLAGGGATEATKRLLAVKMSAFAHEEAEPFLRQYLIGGDPWGPEEYDTSLLTLGQLVADAPQYPIGHYLLGRQLWQRRHAARALPYLIRARQLNVEPEAVAAENLRLLARARFDLGQFGAARELFLALSENEERPLGAREDARDWVARCDWELAQGR